MLAAGGAGAPESEGPERRGSGGKQRGGGRRGAEGRSRAARAASEPESWSCRSPATPACALRSAPAASLRAGPAAGGAHGRETSPERRSKEKGHLSPSEASAPSGAAILRGGAKAAGRPSAPRSARGAAPGRPGRQRRRPEPCPRPLAPGGAAGRRGGAAQTLYKGASPARRRRRRLADAAKVCCLRPGPAPGRRAAPRRRGARSPRCEAAPGRARPGPRAPAACSPRAAANCERGLICIGRRSPLEAGQSARPSANGCALFTSLIAQPHARPAPSPPAAPLMPLPRAGPARC